MPKRAISSRTRTIDILISPVLMCTDLTLEPVEIIRLYGLRFKRAAFRIELGFKQATHIMGSYGYHFWIGPRRWRI